MNNTTYCHTVLKVQISGPAIAISIVINNRGAGDIVTCNAFNNYQRKAPDVWIMV